jgi:hypothetical protein
MLRSRPPKRRVVSSAGRASPLHGECRGFESLTTHHLNQTLAVNSPNGAPCVLNESLQQRGLGDLSSLRNRTQAILCLLTNTSRDEWVLVHREKV